VTSSPSSRRSTHTPGEFEEFAVIDHSVAHPARVYEWFLGGKNNFEVDREAAQRMGSALPGGVEAVRKLARTNREFLMRAVQYLVSEAGISQFLDMGSGIPTSNRDNVHQIAQDVIPSSRVVFVDYDPVVLAMAHEVLRSHPEGRSMFILADVRDVDEVLAKAGETLDFDQPVGLLLVAVFHLMTDDPKPIVERYLAGLPSGSFLVMSNIAADIDPEHTMEMARRYSELAAEPMVPRSHDLMESLFEGLELVEPGIVRAVEWNNPDYDPEAPTPPMWVAVARKP
jgi:S-adenosyl methyltransferase